MSVLYDLAEPWTRYLTVDPEPTTDSRRLGRAGGPSVAKTDQCTSNRSEKQPEAGLDSDTLVGLRCDHATVLRNGDIIGTRRQSIEKSKQNETRVIVGKEVKLVVEIETVGGTHVDFSYPLILF